MAARNRNRARDPETTPPGPPSLDSLTTRQRLVYEAVRAYCRDHDGQSPTLRDLADALGIRSLNGILGHVRALERKQIVSRNPRAARGLRILVEEPIRAERRGGTIVLDCGDRLYHLDCDGALKLASHLLRLVAANNRVAGGD